MSRGQSAPLSFIYTCTKAPLSEVLSVHTHLTPSPSRDEDTQHARTPDADAETQRKETAFCASHPKLELMLLDTVKTKLGVPSPLR